MGSARVCFVVNPLAGIGGPLALKGSDGKAAEIALRRGARLVSPGRAQVFVNQLSKLSTLTRIEVYTAASIMGADYLKGKAPRLSVIYKPEKWPTTAEDTVATVRECCRKGCEIVVFVGGDGTARDVVRALMEEKCDIPILGVPSGVKVYSSVFAENPRAAALALHSWLSTRSTCEGEVVDIDEEAFRRGKLNIKLYAIAKTPCTPYMVGTSKQPSPSTVDEEENKRAIARYVVENMEKCTLYVLGPGTTVAAIAEVLGIKKTLLGVDVIHNGELVATDVDEETLYNIVAKHVRQGGKVKIIVSPIGGQGYIFGRGNQQISPRVIKLVGKSNIIVVATRSKIQSLKKLRVDTGDEETDKMLKGYIRVVVDYGEEQVVRVE